MAAKNREPDYKILTLKNGAALYVLNMPWVKTVGLGVHVNAGTRDEVWPKQAGLAHATEHMVFQGTEEFPDSKSLAEFIEGVGGIMNAYTDSEMTFFYTCLPAEEKERGFKALSQMLRKTLLSQDQITTEMQNIIQEINISNDQPQSFILKKSLEVIYGDHPLARRTLGTKESVSSLSELDFHEWINKFYHPSNFTFVAVGNINSLTSARLFNGYFPEKSRLPANKRTNQLVAKCPTSYLAINKETEQAHVVLRAMGPAAGQRDSQILIFFTAMLSGGMSFPFFQEIRVKRGLCYEIRAAFSPWSDAGTFRINLGTDPEKINEAEAAIREVIGQSKNSRSLLEKTKQLLRGRMAFAFERPMDLISSAGEILVQRKGLRGHKEIIEEIDSITIEEVEDVVNRYLDPSKFIKVVLLPKSPSANAQGSFSFTSEVLTLFTDYLF